MELRSTAETNKLISLIHQLPLSEKKVIKQFLDNELSEKSADDDHSLRDILLSGPVMKDDEYENYKELKNQFDQWAKKLSL